MGKASSASDGDGSTAYNTVFIDTNLDTHLAMIVSDVDTVSDLKKKIMYEHPLCFPDIGEIKIHALKVKRKGYLYHLADSMLVRSAFDGVKKSWFLCADAYSLVKHGENRLSCNPISSNLLVCITNNQEVPGADQFAPVDSVREVSKDLEMEVKHIGNDHCKTSSSDTNKKSDPEIQEKYNVISEKNEMLRTLSEHQEENSQNGTNDMQCSDYLEGALKIGPVVRKKYKIKKKNKDALDDHALKDSVASIDASTKDASQQETIILQNCSGNAGKEVPNDMKMGTEHISDETCKSSSSGISKRSESGIQKKYDLCDRTEVPVTHVEFKNDQSKDKVVDVQCNNLLGEASQSGLAAKKKFKRKKKNGAEDPLKENEALICNSSKEISKPVNMIPENSVENKRNRTYATSDGLSTEPPQDVHLVENSSSGGKKKRKMKSSGPHNEVVAAVPSVKDVREESAKETVGFDHKDSGRASVAAIVPGRSFHGAKLSESRAISLKEKHSDPVQEVGEGNKVPCSSLDIDMNDVDAGNVESKGDASDIAASSSVIGTKSLKKDHAVDAKGHPPLVAEEPNNLDKGIGLSRQDNLVSDYHHKVGTDQAHKIGQERELLQKSNSELMRSEKCKPSSQDETGINDKEVVVSSKLLDGNGIVEPGKFAGKRRKLKSKSKKGKSSVGGMQATLGVEYAKGSVGGISSTEPHKAFHSDRSSDEANKEESLLSQTEKNEVSKIKTVNTYLLGADREADEVSGNELEPLQQTEIDKSREDPVNMDEKVRKKTKKKRSSTAKNLPDALMKEQDVGPKDLTPSTDKIREEDAPCKRTRKTKLVERSSKDQLNGSNLEPGKETGIEIESFHPQHISGTADSSQVQGRPLQANVDGNPPISSRTDEANKNMEVSVCESDGINFNDYFVPSQCQHEAVASAEALDDKVIQAEKTDRKMKAKKNSKKVDVHSLGTSLDLQNSLKSNDNQGSEQKFRGGNSSTIQGSLSKDESDELLVHSNRKSSKVSESRVEAQPSNDIDKLDSIPENVSRLNVVKASGTSGPAHAYSKENIDFVASSSNLGTSEDRIHKRQSRQDQYRITARKASGNNIGKVVNSSNHEKSLLAISGNIFKDGNSESSEDDGVEDSDASTRTPSDYSSSSDHSEVENKANLHTPESGSYGSKRKDVGSKNSLKSYSSDLKDVTLDRILRSSSRFKKAKLAASQSQMENTESQPVDFVPDSQGNL